ncbi:tripartite tricarboxylate transporter substrate binding protein [Pseudoroseomonas cervicalis]|uniref:Bug family tripartite tricarboxylate transporter substrate binding protein n=1 Tax=Teichococcus cervicalis TaxID=204525 RepID=UPI0022F1C850|nr:tripartite tricarboxylate transporter substrate binding protein [Pseudoroseomonas cervicalis]WBV45388.1 tripartite tricarboxylate transporter substrate binding protein [Pseudoroseomonas cervicalis]
MQRRTLLRAGAGALFAAPSLAAPALAQSPWPNRPIRMIVPYTPGAATDAMARLAAQKLQEQLGVTVVVENRSGANGAIGSQAVLQAPADGYTILGSASIHPMAKYVMKSVAYDPVTDFVPIARTARGPCVLVQDRRLPQTTLAETIAAVKAQPGKWSFATSSLGAAGHLASIEFNRLAGTQIEIVPYRGSAPALTDVAAGNVQLMFDPVLATLPMIRGGQLRGLGIATAARTDLAPELPTLAEEGLPGFTFYSWYGIWAPRGVPEEIATRLNQAVLAGLHEPETVQRLAGQGFEPVRESIPELEAFIREDVARNAGLLRLANFEPQ